MLDAPNDNVISLSDGEIVPLTIEDVGLVVNHRDTNGDVKIDPAVGDDICKLQFRVFIQTLGEDLRLIWSFGIDLVSCTVLADIIV
ncbi:hypothetical protein E2542_SST09329 [Spatholobus suberectus]|nr:hypothetical protein E2542_SST09329 [Spatholobus suberectus]